MRGEDTVHAEASMDRCCFCIDRDHETIRPRLAKHGCGIDRPLSRVEQSRRPMQLDQDAIASLQLAA
jgi:hypothetical protein